MAKIGTSFNQVMATLSTNLSHGCSKRLVKEAIVSEQI